MDDVFKAKHAPSYTLQQTTGQQRGTSGTKKGLDGRLAWKIQNKEQLAWRPKYVAAEVSFGLALIWGILVVVRCFPQVDISTRSNKNMVD